MDLDGYRPHDDGDDESHNVPFSHAPQSTLPAFLEKDNIDQQPLSDLNQYVAPTEDETFMVGGSCFSLQTPN